MFRAVTDIQCNFCIISVKTIFQKYTNKYGAKKVFQITFFICEKTHLIKKGSRLKLDQTFNSTSKASESWDLEVFGKVPRSWDSPGATGIFPKTQSPEIFLDFIVLHQKRHGTVPGS